MLDEFQKALVINQSLQVTVWDPQDDDLEFQYQSYVMEIDVPFIKIASPPAREAREIEARMQTGCVIGAILEACPSPLIFYPVVHSKPEKPLSGFWLKIPENPKIEVLQQRRHVRIPMFLPIRVDYAVGSKWITLDARTENVSGGGLRFTSSRSFYKDQDIVIHLQFEKQEPLRLQAKVIFASENLVRRQPEDLYAIACQFYNLNDQQEKLIMRECFQRELRKPV